jgi:hypothetical protein
MGSERWTVPAVLEDLKVKARKEGLWNLWVPEEMDPEGKYGPGLTNEEYAPLAGNVSPKHYQPPACTPLLFRSALPNCSSTPLCHEIVFVIMSRLVSILPVFMCSASSRAVQPATTVVLVVPCLVI